ncbi:MAG: hypothetical protein SH821_10800 [Phototrophicales bacterium]|mgnify:CR=1 FL=1|nr:hypothetical protein [Phototrophicales bacterium]
MEQFSPTLKRLAAAERSIIEITETTWRLLRLNDLGEEIAHMVVQKNEPLRYSADFATTRRLPSSRALPLYLIAQVVLGWSHEDEAWRLGLVVVPDLASARKSRWCEIANWPDPDHDVFAKIAQEAGEALADVLGVPFKVIPPRPEIQRASAQMPALPIALQWWDVVAEGQSSLELIRPARWMRARVVRILWYVFWMAVYVLLSATTLNTNLALPNAGTMLPSPELLPYLGLGMAVVMAVLIGIIVYELFVTPNRIFFDGQSRKVLAYRGDDVKWEKDGHDFSAVYVSHVLRKRRNKEFIQLSEINFHLGGNQFERLLEETPKQNQEYISAEKLKDGVYPLAPATSDTPVSAMQGVTLNIARVLGNLPVMYDQRMR